MIIRVPQSMLYWLIKQPPHQVRNMLLHLPKVSKVSKAKEIPKRGQKAAPKLVDIQSVTKHALLPDQTATTSGEEHVASPPKVSKISKAKEIPKKGQKAAPKPVDNQSATKHALLADQTATTSGEEHVASPPKVSKVSKAKEIPKKGQKAAPKPVDNQSATKHALLADQTTTTSGEEHVASPPKVSKISKAKEIPKRGQKAAPKPVDNQSATKHALLADQTVTTSGEEHVASPPKVSKAKAKEIPKRGQKAAPKPVDNQSVTKHALLADQTVTTSGEEHVVSPPKVSKAKEIPSQKAAPKLVDNQSATKAMASNSSDMDVGDYYIVEDANESASSKYVPCINYANDKVYPEDEKNGWIRLEQDTGPPNIYRFEGSCCNYLNLNNYTPGAVFDEFFEGKMWTRLSENTNKYVHAKLRQAKDKGDNDPIELLSEGADQNPCA